MSSKNTCTEISRIKFGLAKLTHQIKHYRRQNFNIQKVKEHIWLIDQNCGLQIYIKYHRYIFDRK